MFRFPDFTAGNPFFHQLPCFLAVLDQYVSNPDLNAQGKTTFIWNGALLTIPAMIADQE